MTAHDDASREIRAIEAMRSALADMLTTLRDPAFSRDGLSDFGCNCLNATIDALDAAQDYLRLALEG
jgi:hypothetical protein